MKILILLLLSLSLLKASDTFLPEDPELSIKAALAILNPQLLGTSLPCSICSKVVSFAVGQIVKHGCGFLLKVEMAAACEAAGLGPEDPLSDICVVAMIGACTEIASLIANHITDPTIICNKIHICT